MRRLSLNMRLAQDAQATDEIEAVIGEITHPDLPQPILFSSDNPVRISTDPLMFATRSTWRSPDGKPRDFLFVLISALLPGDRDEGPSAATLVLETVDNAVIKALRGTTTPPTISLAVIAASEPDDPQEEFLDFDLVQAPYSATEIRLEFSEAHIEDMAFPADRLTKTRCPGVHP